MRNAIQLYDPSAKSGDSGIDQLGAVGLERGERASLIPTHQPAVAGNIRAQDCGEPAFNALPHHGSLFRIVWVVGDSLGIAVNRV